MLGLLLSSLMTGLSQQTYWAFLTDKPAPDAGRLYVSPQAMTNRAMLGLPLSQPSDLPLNPAYLVSLESLAHEVHTASKWFNAVCLDLTEAQAHQVAQLPFVKSLQPIEGALGTTAIHVRDNETAYFDIDAFALEQINSDQLMQHSLNGTGVVIGLIDGNFFGADRNTSLQHVFADERLLGYRDFVEPEKQEAFFANPQADEDFHGHAVWQMIAGHDTTDERTFGLALGAAFYLARTDHTVYESRAEEAHWVAALEWMDSLGVRLVNSSLGYSRGFDKRSENHRPGEMDGQTTLISRAAEMGAKEKGMIIITSAGNEGHLRGWGIVSAPADAPSVISVGATNRIGEKPDYSGRGPAALAYLKPNIACFSNMGTSFSAPIITGMFACMLQKQPDLSVKEAHDLLERASHLFPYGNNYLGNGIPQVDRILSLMENPAQTFPPPNMLDVSSPYSFQDPDWQNQSLVVFHKTDRGIVVKQETFSPQSEPYRIKKPGKATSTTLVSGTKVLELNWTK